MRRLRPFLAALSIAAASLASSSAAHALAPSAFVPSTAAPIAPTTIEALTGGEYAAADVSRAQYSPDHSRILFLTVGSRPQSARFVVMRADGSQIHPLPYYYAPATPPTTVNGDAWSEDGTAVTYKVIQPDSPSESGWWQFRVTVDADVDTWSLVPADEIGEVTSDGKYRIVVPNFVSYSGSVVPTPYRVVDLATGIGYSILLGGPGSFAWDSTYDCGRTGLAPDPANIEAALSGPHPACSFPALTGNDVAPAKVSALTGGRYAPSEISEAQYSPDHKRILFLQREQSDPYAQPTPTYERYRRYVAMRADGSQIHPFTSADAVYYDVVVGGSWSTDSSRVSYFWFPGSQDYGGGGLDWTVSVGAGDVDTWSLTPRDSLGTMIPGSRYRLIPPHLNGNSEAYRVIDVDTGVGYDVLQGYQLYFGRYDWLEGCGSSGLAPSPDNIAAALSGDRAACSFARRADTPTPTPTDTPTPTITPGPKQIFLPENAANPSRTAAATIPPLPTPTPVPTSKPQSATTGPVVKVVSFTRSLSLLRSRGFTVKYGPTTATRLRAWLMIPLGGPAFESVAQGTLTRPSKTGGAFRIRLSPKGRKALHRITSTTLTLRVSGADAAGHQTVVETPVRLK